MQFPLSANRWLSCKNVGEHSCIHYENSLPGHIDLGLVEEVPDTRSHS